jgi:peptidoglycan/xylan/chitin deacetylase (PgdA/CDA1 family)
MIPIVAYHKVDSLWELGITTVSVARFARQMEYLRANKIRIKSLSEMLVDNRLQDLEAASCCITFDDSYNSLLDNAISVIFECGFRVSFFAVSGYVGKPNTWDANFFGRTFEHMGWMHIKELLAQGHEIGSHTVTHRDLTLLKPQQIKDELERSKKTIEDTLGVAVKYLSYPFGKTNRTICDMAQEAGYTAAFTMRAGRNDLPYPFAIGRRGVYRIDTMRSFQRKVTNQAYNFEDFKGAIINWCAQGTPLWKQVILHQ